MHNRLLPILRILAMPVSAVNEFAIERGRVVCVAIVTALALKQCVNAERRCPDLAWGQPAIY
jgi:hypothetical protein